MNVLVERETDRQTDMWTCGQVLVSLNCVLFCVAVIDKVQDQLESAKPGPLVDEVVCIAFIHSYSLLITVQFDSSQSCRCLHKLACLSVCHFVCLSVCLCITLFACLSVCLSVCVKHVKICAAINQSINHKIIRVA